MRADLPEEPLPWSGFDLRRPLHAALFLLPLFFFALNLALHAALGHERFMAWFPREDGVWEDTQALAYLAASACAAALAWRRASRREHAHAALATLLALGLCLCFLEEISWGQRLLHFPLPAWLAKANLQGEATLHNLRAIHHHQDAIVAVISLAASLAWCALPARWLRWRGALLAWALPGPPTVLYFGANAIYALGLLYQDKLGLSWARVSHQEIFETLFALGFLVTTLWNLDRLGRGPARARP